SVGVAIPKDRSQYGYLSEHHSFGQTDKHAGDYAEDLAASMLATVLGVDFDPNTSYDERKDLWRVSDKIVITRNVTQSAIGDRDGLWTSVVAAAVFAEQPAVTPSDPAALDARLVAALTRRRRPVTQVALLRAARVGRPEHAAAVARLAAMESDGRALRLPGDRWALPGQAGLVAGRVVANPGGFGFLVPDDPAADDV